MQGIIHSYESLAAVDGAGLRYAIFMAGCPLRCVFCHNPDTWEMMGEKTEPEALVKKVSRYKTYFGSDGGITFSGGEPLLQAEFIKETIPYLKEAGINYAVDTSGITMLSDNIRYVLDNAQTVLLDLKFWDDESYRRYTGIGIENVLKTFDYLKAVQKRTWVRTVIIPGINDNEDIIDLYLSNLKDFDFLERYELLAFHTMGFYKYEKAGIKNHLIDTPPLSAEKRDRLQKYADKRLYKYKQSLK